MLTSIEYYYVHSSDSFDTFQRMFYKMPQIIFEYSLDCLRTYPGMFGNVPWNIWEHSPECLETFSGMFENIPRNVWWHLLECLRTIPRMFENLPRNVGDITRNVWEHSPYSPRYPHSVPCSCIPEFIHCHFPFNRSYKFYQCLGKIILITIATNVWFKFFSFSNDIWSKRVFELFSSARKYMECWGVYEYFSFVEVSHEYVVVARFRGIYRANAVVSLIFFGGGTQVPIFDTSYQ